MAGPRNRILRNIRQQIEVQKNLKTDDKALAAASTQTGDSEPELQPLSAPGHVQLYSYYKPSLQAGPHHIHVQQKIYAQHSLDHDDHDEKYLELNNDQAFEVYGDRFNLPANAIHQIYPPQGHGDTSDVLPHIVFNDAHLPWERAVSVHDLNFDGMTPSKPTQILKDVSPTLTPTPAPAPHLKSRNSVPWLALLTFTEDELRLSADQLTALSAGQTLPNGQTILEQNHNTLDVTVSLDTVLNHLPKTVGFATPVKDDPLDPVDQSQAIKMVFVPGDLFTSFFCGYDSDGYRILPDASKPLDRSINTAARGQPDLSRYRLLSHVRQVSHSKMAESSNLTVNQDAGTADDEGVYSIVISHRTGPLPAPKRSVTTPKSKTKPESTGDPVALPKSCVVHLVSLEGIEAHDDAKSSLHLPLDDDPTKVAATRVGLVSLYSWTYNLLPPLSANFLDNMRVIGKEVPDSCWLRAPTDALSAMETKGKVAGKGGEISQRLHQRLVDGYSLVRYIPKTGEQTLAFCRGALSPTLPKHPPTDFKTSPSGLKSTFWPSQSNFSSNLQIIDSHLGIPDITYATAWELGRTLAIADKAFTAAINRLRHSISIHATNTTKTELQGDGASSKAAAIANIAQVARLMTNMPDQLADGSRVVDPVARFSGSVMPDHTMPPTSVRRPDSTRALFTQNVHTTAAKLASIKSDQSSDLKPFNEIETPNSPDWAIVLSWIVNKFHLYNVPAHYLISDPSYLPREAIRFFYIDPTWVDSLLDGALSVGNHLENEDDVVRQAFKYQINKYLSTPLHENHDFNPQLPIFGFILRSNVVEAYPNLEVHAPRHPDPTAVWEDLEDQKDPRSEALRLDLLDKDILFCLFDRRPGYSNFTSIVISQPPHQQRYTVGAEFGPGMTATGSMGPNQLEVQIVKTYTVPEDIKRPVSFDGLDTRKWIEGIPGDTGHIQLAADKPNPTSIFDWDTNTVIVEKYVEACRNVLTQEMGDRFVDDKVSSALAGIQLADHIRYLQIQVQDLGSTPASDQVRQIYLPSIEPPSQPSTSGLASQAKSPPAKVLSTAKAATTTPTSINTKIQLNPAQPNIPAPHRTAPVVPIQPPVIPANMKLSTNPANLTSASFLGQFRPIIFKLGLAKSKDQRFTISLTPGANKPIDIVFAFLPQLKQIQGLQIHLLEVWIPTGSKNTDLCETYDIFFGGGAKMLSNQRFNPHLNVATTTLQNGTKQNWLLISLVPRTRKQLVPLEKNPDMNFVLNQVRLNNVASGATAVQIFTKERYGQIDTDGSWIDVGTGAGVFLVVKVAQT